MLLQADATTLLIVFGAIILAMGCHEAMHAYTSHALGDTTASDEGRLTLNPIKHIDVLTTILIPLVLILAGVTPIFAAKPVPFNPARVKFGEYGAAIIGIVGPFTNLLLAVITALLIRLIDPSPLGLTLYAMEIFMTINVGFFVFNMIPFPPLDGSRLLYAFAPRPLQDIMFKIESLGFAAIVVFIFLLFPIIGPFIMNISQAILNLLTRLIG